MEDLEDFEYFLEMKASKQMRLENTKLQPSLLYTREPMINICDACFRGIRNMLQKGEEINCNVNFSLVS